MTKLYLNGEEFCDLLDVSWVGQTVENSYAFGGLAPHQDGFVILRALCTKQPRIETFGQYEIREEGKIWQTYLEDAAQKVVIVDVDDPKTVLNTYWRITVKVRPEKKEG